MKVYYESYKWEIGIHMRTTKYHIACIIDRPTCKTIVKIHHYIIYFVWPLHSKPGMESSTFLTVKKASAFDLNLFHS